MHPSGGGKAGYAGETGWWEGGRLKESETVWSPWALYLPMVTWKPAEGWSSEQEEAPHILLTPVHRYVESEKSGLNLLHTRRQRIPYGSMKQSNAIVISKKILLCSMCLKIRYHWYVIHAVKSNWQHAVLLLWQPDSVQAPYQPALGWVLGNLLHPPWTSCPHL